MLTRPNLALPAAELYVRFHMQRSKSIAKLTADDVAAVPVWKHKAADRLLPGEDESWVESVAALPVDDAFDHYFATQVKLADGSMETCIIGKTEPLHPELNEEEQLFFFCRGARQHLWSNHSHWLKPEASNPVALAAFLGKSIEEVFPFSYDLSSVLRGDPLVLRRTVKPIVVEKVIDPVEAAMAAALQHLELHAGKGK